MVEGLDGRRAGRGAEDGDQAGDPERHADLACHRVEGGAGREALLWQRRGGGAAEGGQHEPDAEAGEQAPRQVGAGPVGRGADVRDPPQSTGGEAQGAGHADSAVAHVARPATHRGTR